MIEKFTKRNPVIDKIIDTVCDDFFADREAILSKSRRRELVVVRQAIMSICKDLTEASLGTIGFHLGGRDHSTVIHGIDTIADLTINDRVLKQKIQDAKNRSCMAIGQYEAPDEEFYSENLHCENWESKNIEVKPLEPIEE